MFLFTKQTIKKSLFFFSSSSFFSNSLSISSLENKRLKKPSLFWSWQSNALRYWCDNVGNLAWVIKLYWESSAISWYKLAKIGKTVLAPCPRRIDLKPILCKFWIGDRLSIKFIKFINDFSISIQNPRGFRLVDF